MVKKRKKETNNEEQEPKKYCCSVFGREISEEEYESFDGMCWEWDDQLTEESEMMFGDVM